jgi:GMP synthase (glutamine-hydrolysing)
MYMGEQIHPKSVVILDFGGQYAHLIARRVRECGAFSDIRPAETKAEELKGAAGIILSGGPASVYDEGAPKGDREIFGLGIPILGICYGHQWIAHVLRGEVRPGKTREYGRTVVRKSEIPVRPRPGGRNPRPNRTSSGRAKSEILLKDFPKELTVWMSHGDTVSKLPPGFQSTASSKNCGVAAMEDSKRKIFGTQFHLEVTHTPRGVEILRNFVRLCDPAPWSIEDFAAHIVDQVKREVDNRKVFMLVSGGVDSTVAFTLLEKTLGKDRVYGLLVDTGLMRRDETNSLTSPDLVNLHVEDASDRFFESLEGIYDPEEKRRIIGETFLVVQRDVAKRLKLDGPDWVLGQGTIYPDTIETGGTKHADTIKTHHNRVEEIQKMIEEGRVVEPLRDLYKDEVRKLGELLGLPHDLVWRHPFPGPGLGVRILCAKEEVWPEGWRHRHEEIEANILRSIGNLPKPYHIRVLPILSVGVQGDARTYRHAVAIFTKAEPPWEAATSVPNRVREINRVLLCTSHHEPPDLIFTPGGITRERADLLREADAIVDEEMRKAKLYESIWQFPVVLLPIGLEPKGLSIALRPVDSTEAMTANATRLPKEFLATVTGKILALPGIDLVFYDLTNKPPATIEWE